MKKFSYSSKVLMITLSICAISTHAQAVGGLCSGGICGSSAAKNADAARQRSFKTFSETTHKLMETYPPNAEMLIDQAGEAHKKVIGEWVSKKNPQLKAGSEGHKAKVNAEFQHDQDKISDSLNQNNSNRDVI